MIDRVSLRRPTRRERPTSPLRRVRDIVSWIRDPTSRAPIAVGFARLIHLTARHTPRGVCGIGVVNHPVRVHAAAFYANEYLDFPIKGRIGRAARNDQPFVAVHLLRPLSLASTGQRVDEEIGRGAKITAKRRRLLPSLARPPRDVLDRLLGGEAVSPLEPRSPSAPGAADRPRSCRARYERTHARLGDCAGNRRTRGRRGYRGRPPPHPTAAQAPPLRFPYAERPSPEWLPCADVVQKPAVKLEAPRHG